MAAEVGDYLVPNSLPAELHNLIIVLFVCFFVLWAFRLCRSGLHLQDLKSGTSQSLLLHIDGVGPFMQTIRSLTRGHLRQFLRTQRNVPPTAVPRLEQKFTITDVSPASATDSDGCVLPFGASVKFQSTVPCTIQAFWGVDRAAVSALSKGGVRGLRARVQRKATRRSRKAPHGRSKGSSAAGIGILAPAGRHGRKDRGYQQLQDDLASSFSGTASGVEMIDVSAPRSESSVELPAALFPPSAFAACSEPQTFAPSSELHATFRAPMPHLDDPLEPDDANGASATAPAAVPVLDAKATSDTVVSLMGSSRRSSRRPATETGRHTDRHVPLVLVLRANSAWTTQALASPSGTSAASRATILYDVMALKFPSAMLRRALGRPPSEGTMLRPVHVPPGDAIAAAGAGAGAGEGAESGKGAGADDVAAAAAHSGAGGASGGTSDDMVVQISEAGTEGGVAAGASGGGDGAGAGEGSGSGAAAAVDASSGQSLSISRHWAVTQTTCYQLKAIFGLRDGQECVVCLTNPKSVILLPCRHMCVCEVCFTHVDKCPVCRSSYTSHLTFQGEVEVGGSDSDDDSDLGTTGGFSAGAVSAGTAGIAPAGAKPMSVQDAQQSAVEGGSPAAASAGSAPTL